MNLIEMLRKRNLLKNYKEESDTWHRGLQIKPRTLTDGQVRYVTLLLVAQIFLMRELIFQRLPKIPRLERLECLFKINGETYGDRSAKKVVGLCMQVESSELQFEFRAYVTTEEYGMTPMAKVIFTGDLIAIYGDDTIFPDTLLVELPKL